MTYAVVLAAGEGTRMWPFNTIMPKCLLPVGGKPSARWICEWIVKAGFPVQLVCLAKERDMFEFAFRDMPEVKIVSSERPRGTAGQIKDITVPGSEPNMIVWYGDCLVKCPLGELLQVHNATGATVTLATTRNVKLDYGVVKLNPGRLARGGNSVSAFVEKPYVDDYLWTGVAVINRIFINDYLGDGNDLAGDVFPMVIRAKGRVVSYAVDSEWYDVGNLVSYRHVNEIAKERLGIFS